MKKTGLVNPLWVLFVLQSWRQMPEKKRYDSRAMLPCISEKVMEFHLQWTLQALNPGSYK